MGGTFGIGLYIGPFSLLTAWYNVGFCFVIVICESDPNWSACKIKDFRENFFTGAAFLATPWGRAGFYTYVGLLNIFLQPGNPLWMILHVCLGGLLIFLSICMLGQYLCLGQQ